MVLMQVAGVILVLELGLVLLAVLLMPLVTAGERSRHCLERSVKLVLWASTSLIVLAVALQGVAVYELWRGGEWPAWPMVLTVALYCAWAVGLVVRGGSRYAGIAEGPAWERHSPLCMGCGYVLTGLAAGSTCPECGQGVAASLPERRQPSPFAAARSVFGQLLAFPKTYLLTLWGRGFDQCLATRDGLAPARRFAVWTAAVTALALVWLADRGIRFYERKTHIRSWVHVPDLPTFCTTAVWLWLGLLAVMP